MTQRSVWRRRRLAILSGAAVVGVGAALAGSYALASDEPPATPIAEAPPVAVRAGGADAAIAIPPIIGQWVDLSKAKLVGAGPSGRAVFIAPGAAGNAGLVCMFTAKPTGTTDVVPLTCNPPDLAAERGLDLEQSESDGSLQGIHVRVPENAGPVLRLFKVAASGGTVQIQSGDRQVTLDFANQSEANARADRDLEEYTRTHPRATP